MMKKLFNMTEEQIRKQSGTRPGYDIDPESKMSPISPNDTFLEPCIRGSQKIMNDPKKKEMFYRIYRGIGRDKK